ncbi:M99 family carboxypeptidase catalytic domain-containing protein [Sulfuricurvum sp.]|uniref:M99 family carboxypeptidase catalytic domain-containing protein n=1 Tax=Sulfuricurvum sp. TaxID=2025608 RepID=UPI0025D168BB|nr:M99 family carboxypeptidase catalytic domain-containing protein [Sulfuricurvum sp.]
MRFSFLLPFFLIPSLYCAPFSLIKKETDTLNSPTLLVIGGIHGNEPGSYFAAALLSQYYQIKRGNLWVVPDLNRPSIQQNSRGINGDMNRKFSDIDPQDADFQTVQEIQKIMTEKQVGLILNLHDGHGFYRKEHLNTIFNPNAWGQTCVIDQGALNTEHPYGNLNAIASKVSIEMNNGLIEDHHLFDVRNTNTRFDDEAMRHSLTYFAVSHDKPAFAIETSKNLPTLHHKVFYQLRAIECYMRLMGIEFERSFDLNLDSIQQLLKNNKYLTINNNIYLDLQDLKNSLSFIPLQSDSNEFKFAHPLGSIQKNKEQYDLFIGNQKISTLIPSYHPKEVCSEPVCVIVDGKRNYMPFATHFFATADFKVVNNDSNMRVNIIGFTQKGIKDESNVSVELNDLDSKYSIDTSNKSYRIEFYQQNRFCGMVLVHFN